MKKVTMPQMPRGGVTQLRTLTYDSGQSVASVTMPEPRGYHKAGSNWLQDDVLNYSFAFDSLGRPATMTDVNAPYGPELVASELIYNMAGQMTAGQFFNVKREWAFNDRGQLTREKAGYNTPTTWIMDYTYAFSATENDGRVQSRTDAITGEVLNYGYDELGRLTVALAPTTGARDSDMTASEI